MRLASIRKGLLIAAVAVALPGCTKQQLQGQGSSYLIIDELTAAPGHAPDEDSGVLDSDVVTKGTVFSDIGLVQLRLAMKDPGSPAAPTQPTSNNFITVNRYSVRFLRSDGRNTQGVDVPWAFEGAATGTVSESGLTLEIALVRAQSKLESPLFALRELGGAGLISTIAEVTVYGHDQAGRSTSVKGTISVNFADFGDPD